jgi:hypothetical protein
MCRETLVNLATTLKLSRKMMINVQMRYCKAQLATFFKCVYSSFNVTEIRLHDLIGNCQSLD